MFTYLFIFILIFTSILVLFLFPRYWKYTIVPSDGHVFALYVSVMRTMIEKKQTKKHKFFMFFVCIVFYFRTTCTSDIILNESINPLHSTTKQTKGVGFEGDVFK